MNKAWVEGLKEPARWIVLFIAGWIIGETAKQVGNLPEFVTVVIWVFTYKIPVQSLIAFLLALAGRAVDKAIHEIGKFTNNQTMIKGITRF